MRGDHYMQGWLFVNSAALMLYYRTCAILKSNGLLMRYFPGNLLVQTERLKRLKIGEKKKFQRYQTKS